MIRCPRCDATNPDGAAWCNQCLTPLAEPRVSYAAAPKVAPEQAQPATPDPGIRRRGDRFEWECPSCGTYHDLDVGVCAVCGTPFQARYEPRQQPVERNWMLALALSAVLPGAGHLSVDEHGSGIARMILFILWLGGAVGLLTSGAAAGLVASTPLVIGVLVLWLGSLYDVMALARGSRQVLTGRTLLWLVICVTLLAFIGMTTIVASRMRAG